MVSGWGSSLCTAPKFSLPRYSPSPCPPQMERLGSGKLWKDINGGLFILYKDALFASRGERNKCQEEKRHCGFLSFGTGRWELLTSGHMSAIPLTQQCPTFQFA